MWSDAARQASLSTRRASGGAVASNVSTGAPPAVTAGQQVERATKFAASFAAHQAATHDVPRNMAQSIDRSPPTNYRAPSYAPVSNAAPVMRSYDRSNLGDQTRAQRSYAATRTAPVRRIADYGNSGNQVADQGRSAAVIDRLRATYPGY